MAGNHATGSGEVDIGGVAESLRVFEARQRHGIEDGPIHQR